MESKIRPVIGITTGCSCGIGPEIVARALADKRVTDICDSQVFAGDPSVVPHHLDGGGLFQDDITACGSDSLRAVEAATHAALRGEIHALVTAPINKSHWKAALARQRFNCGGCPFSGHTEYLAHLASAKSVAMMMVSPRLKVSLVTTHAALKDVPKLITIEKICDVVKLTGNFLKTHELKNSRTQKLAICALNPHAGDKGAFGDEEEKIIIPAIKKLQAKGLDVSGPWPADTVFWKAVNGEFDAVIAMYHDQALVPIKTLDFKDTVNVTLGLPFVRTSPDHGTADDIAGKGIADHTNMVRAIEMAVDIVRAKSRTK